MNQSDIIRDYKILRPLGSGGMGTVYLAEDSLLERQVAIKVLNPTLTQDEQFVERFRREAKIQSTLIHPHIVSLFTFFFDAGQYCMVMEYAPGRTLRQLITEEGKLAEDRAIPLFVQILHAVEYAHSRGVVHRDLKPGNILISEEDQVKVMDFGIAKMMGDAGMTRTGAKLGTVYYMSPEQVRAQKDIDQRTDIYSLGMMLYEMLTGVLPLNTDTESDFEIMKQIIAEEWPDPILHNRSISPRSNKAIALAVRKKREERFAAAGQFLEALGLGSAHAGQPGAAVRRVGSGKGSIEVAADEGMSVLLNGKRIGMRTPCEIKDLEFGKYTLRVDGKSHFSEPVEVEISRPGQVVKVQPALIPYGWITVKTAYSGLNLRINGDPVLLNQANRLMPGTYTIEPEQAYLKPAVFELQPGEKKVLDFDTIQDKVQLEFNTGRHKTELEITHQDSGSIFKEQVTGIKSLELMPGTHALRILSPPCKTVREVMLQHGCQRVDLEEDLDRIRKRKKVVRGLVWAACITLLLTGPSIWLLRYLQLSGAWNLAKNTNTYASYEAFLADHPDSKFAAEAQQLQEASFWKMQDTNTIGSYETYLKKYETGAHAEEAKQKIESLLRQRIDQHHAIQDMLDYRHRFGSYPLAYVVNRAYDEARWDETRLKDSLEAYASYLQEFPNGEHFEEAHNLYDDAAWQQASQVDTPDAYQQYLNQFSEGRHKAQAEYRMVQLGQSESEESGGMESYSVAFRVANLNPNQPLNLQEEPDIFSAKVVQIPRNGIILKYLGESKQVNGAVWYHLEYQGHQGWANSRFLEKGYTN
ncbi:MAG TPA: protein kinase [bacterium]|nr:protein kinase [bacterium]HPR88284.1 protein kinase [bacterium]